MERKENIFDKTKDEIIDYGLKKGLKPFQPKLVYSWLYKKHELDPLKWSNIPLNFRKNVLSDFDFSLPYLIKETKSIDGTTKLLLQLKDKNQIECVFIPQERERITLCISTQVGCPIKCKFCLTGFSGFKRSLTPSEIFLQTLILQKKFSLYKKGFNIVFMGMGEPLLNFENLKEALKILMDNDGFSISKKRITISTVGIKDKLEEYLDDPHLPLLAISLHSAIEEKRRELIKSPLILSVEEIRKILIKNTKKERDYVSIEYVLIKDFNDKDEDIKALLKFCKGLKVKVNLIPYNQNPYMNFSTPEQERVLKFQEILSQHYISITIRKSRGKDILAACGQLAITKEERINEKIS